MLSRKRILSPPAWKRSAQLNIIGHSTLVHGQNSGLEVTFEFTFESANGLGRRQRVDDVHGGGEQNRVSTQAGFMRQGHNQVSFPEADASHEDDVGFVFGEGEAKEVLDLGTIDFLGPVPVELVERFETGKAGGGHAALNGQLLATLGLPVNEPGQIIDMGPLFLRGLGGQRRVLLGHRQKFEGGQLFGQSRFGIVHDAPPFSDS